MKIKLNIILLFVFAVFTNLYAQELFIDSKTFMNGINPGEPIEKWDYNIDGLIWPYQWNCSSQSGNNAGSSPVAVDLPLQYDGYYMSSVPNAFKMNKLASGGRSTVFSITDQTTYNYGSYYLAFLIKVESFPVAGTVGVVMLDGSHAANFRKTCFAIRKIDDDTYSMGIDMAENNVSGDTQVSGTYDIGTTYLVVLKHDMEQDKYSLFVNPDVNQPEPAPLITNYNTQTPLSNNGLRGVTVKQRSHYSAIVGGLCLANSWEKALTVVSSVKNPTETKGRIIKVEYFSITGKKVCKPTMSEMYLKKLIYENGEVEWTKNIYNGFDIK